VRANPNSWKRDPFTTGEAIPYQDRFSETEFAALQDGLIPQAMEDKWFVYFEEPYLFLHRSWTGEPVYRVRLSTDADGVNVAEALCVVEILNPAMADYQARLLDFLIGNLLLGKAKPFPLAGGFVDPENEALLQHAIAGTGYPQVEAESDD
jgi:hypothetical protein